MEEIAVLAADRRRPKPREARRPDWIGGKGKKGIDRAFGIMASTANTIR
ncbi:MULTISPECIES: hypothetical protein [unclassified Nonomuraea]